MTLKLSDITWTCVSDITLELSDIGLEISCISLEV